MLKATKFLSCSLIALVFLVLSSGPTHAQELMTNQVTGVMVERVGESDEALPTNIARVSWLEVAGATGYNVHVDTVFVTTVPDAATSTELTLYIGETVQINAFFTVDGVTTHGLRSVPTTFEPTVLGLTGGSIENQVTGVGVAQLDDGSVQVTWDELASTDTFIGDGYNIHVDGAYLATVLGVQVTSLLLENITTESISVSAFTVQEFNAQTGVTARRHGVRSAGATVLSSLPLTGDSLEDQLAAAQALISELETAVDDRDAEIVFLTAQLSGSADSGPTFCPSTTELDNQIVSLTSQLNARDLFANELLEALELCLNP